MKTKRKILIIVAIIIAFVCVTCFLNFLHNAFWRFIGEQLDKEEQERIEALERGEIVIGRDTLFVWKNKYVLMHYSDNDVLNIHYENGEEDSIIGDIKKYKVKNDSLYIVSEDGYVVIDENALCKVCLTIPELENAEGYFEGENSIIKVVDDDNVGYIGSFDEFSESEQKVLKKMEQGSLWF